MELRYHDTHDGKKFYQVLNATGAAIFLGTVSECRRFMKIHREKVRRHFSRSRHTPAEILDLLRSER